MEGSKDKITPLSDTGVSAVGVKHCGEPEECSKVASEEAKNSDGKTTSPTDESYMTAGVGKIDGVTDVGNTPKFTSVRGESYRTGVIISDEHC